MSGSHARSKRRRIASRYVPTPLKFSRLFCNDRLIRDLQEILSDDAQRPGVVAGERDVVDGGERDREQRAEHAQRGPDLGLVFRASVAVQDLGTGVARVFVGSFDQAVVSAVDVPLAAPDSASVVPSPVDPTRPLRIGEVTP